MKEMQAALVDRIKNAVDENGDSIFASASVEAYAGQVGKDGIKNSFKLPGALVMFREGSPPQTSTGSRFDILVITESQSFEKGTNLNNNLQASSDIAWYLQQYAGWTYSGKNYLIDVQNNKISVGLILQSARHTVISVSVTVRKLI